MDPKQEFGSDGSKYRILIFIYIRTYHHKEYTCDFFLYIVNSSEPVNLMNDSFAAKKIFESSSTLDPSKNSDRMVPNIEFLFSFMYHHKAYTYVS